MLYRHLMEDEIHYINLLIISGLININNLFRRKLIFNLHYFSIRKPIRSHIINLLKFLGNLSIKVKQNFTKLHLDLLMPKIDLRVNNNLGPRLK